MHDHAPGQSNANRVGTPYTFYVQRNLLGYTYTDCGGSHPWQLTPEERSVLGAGREPHADEQGLGPFGNLAAAGALLGLLAIVARRTGRQPPLTPAGAHP